MFADYRDKIIRFTVKKLTHVLLKAPIDTMRHNFNKISCVYDIFSCKIAELKSKSPKYFCKFDK